MKNKIIHKDADLLLAHILGKPREYVLAHPDVQLSLLQRFRFHRLLRKRQAGVPLAYLTGHKEFFGLNFLVNTDVLVPRPETETLVEAVLEKLSKESNATLIDIGTGSGCIPISIMKAKKNEGLKIIATDISQRALRVAKKNAECHGVKIIFLQNDLLLPSIQEKNIFITANLPYLTESQFINEPSIQHEPKSALVAKGNGLALYKKLLKQIQAHHFSELTCFFEIDPIQTEEIKKEVYRHFPQASMTIKKDLAGLDRVVIFTVS